MRRFRVPGSRPTDRKGDAPISTTDARINERIRAREVRLVGANGEQIGVKPLPEALHIAREHDLDLVEVAPNANPPVCKIMDFGKFKYEQDVRRKESRRKTSNVVIKEMKFRPKIDEHDYTTKTKHVERFLNEGSKVKITIMFRGREMAHPELGKRILDRIAEQVKDVGNVEAAPRVDGRNMLMVLAPVKKQEPKTGGAKPRPAEPPQTGAPAAEAAPPAAPTPAEPGPVPSLAARARQVLQTYCHRCHGRDGSNEGGFNYVLDRDQLLRRKKVVPGDPGRSRLFRRLTSDDEPMPPEDEKPRPGKEDVAEANGDGDRPSADFLVRKYLECVRAGTGSGPRYSAAAVRSAAGSERAIAASKSTRST